MDNIFYRIAITGRTNAGKSSLINTLTKQKLAAVSKTVNTTRKPIRGLLTWKATTLLLFDSPGVCQIKTILDRILLNNLRNVIKIAEIIWLMVEIGEKWKKDLEILTKLIQAETVPVILLLNKLDQAKRETVFAYIKTLPRPESFVEIIPISAKTGQNLDKLLNVTVALITKIGKKQQLGKNTSPQSIMSKQEIANEVIREQIIFHTHAEVPHQVATKLQTFVMKAKKLFIDCQIVVATEQQKKIILGQNGQRIKQIRLDSSKMLNTLFKRYINLHLEVKIIEKWYQKREVIKDFLLTGEDYE